MEMVEMNEGLCGGGEGGGDNDSGSDSGGRFGTEHPSRPEPARWPHTTSSHRPPWDKKRGADGDDASISTGGNKRLAEGGRRQRPRDGTAGTITTRRTTRQPAGVDGAVVPWRHGGSGNGGGTGGPYRAPPPYRAPAAGAPSVATEGGAAEMETAGTAGDLGDGRGG